MGSLGRQVFGHTGERSMENCIQVVSFCFFLVLKREDENL